MSGLRSRRDPRRSRIQTYTADSAKSNPVFHGDLVVLETDGHVIAHQDGDVAGAIGIVAGLLDTKGIPAGAVKSAVSTRYLPASSEGLVMILTDPDEEFAIDSNGTVSESAKGANADVVNGSPNSSLGLSGIQLDTASIATTANLPLRIVDRVVEPGNDWGSANPMKLIVKINNHQDRNTTGV